MDIKDLLTIIATILSPLIAVQVSQFIERKRQKRDEQLQVFKTLMATRAARLDPRHVESLNVIDVVFNGTSKKEKLIRALWKKYLDHLNDRTHTPQNWHTRSLDLFVELLQSMAIFLGFDFDDTHIKNQGYYPTGFNDIEEDNVAIRKAFKDILTGKSALPVKVENAAAHSQQSSS